MSQMCPLFYSRHRRRWAQAQSDLSPVWWEWDQPRGDEWKGGGGSLYALCMHTVHWLVMLGCRAAAGVHTAALCLLCRQGCGWILSKQRGTVTGLCNDTLYQKPVCWQARTLSGVIMSIPHQELQQEQLWSVEHVEEICTTATCSFMRF